MSTANKFNLIIPPQDIGAYPGCLEKLVAGDAGAFAWLYTHYSRRLYDYAFLLSGDGCLSEDLVQDVFLKLWKKRSDLAGVANVNAYMHMMIRNALHDAWRKSARDKEHLERYVYLQAEEDVEVLLEREAMVGLAVRGLTERQQLVYRLIREEGLTRAQVSKGLGVSECTVKALMQKALRGVRGRMRAGG
jgi:RNA polymerase sigma factor (sigma-70 family)